MKTIKKRGLLLLLIVSMMLSIIVGALMFSTESVNVSASTNVFEMNIGASVSLSGDGLRFRVKMDESTKNTVNDSDNKLSIIIMSKEVYDAGVGKGKTNAQIYDVVKNEYCQEIFIEPQKIYEEEGFYYGNAVLTNIADNNNQKMNFSAFAKLGETFTENSTWNNLYNVVNSAFNDSSIDYSHYIIENKNYNSWYGTEAFPVVFNSKAQYDTYSMRCSSLGYIVDERGFYIDKEAFCVSESSKDYTLSSTVEGTLSTNIEGFSANVSGTTLTITNNSSLSNGNGEILRVTNGSDFVKYFVLADHIISNVTELNAYFENHSLTGYAILVNDLDVANVNLPQKSWNKDYNISLSGTFDGNGHTISNFIGWAGFIPTITSTGVLKNLILLNSSNTSPNAGMFVHGFGGTIMDCFLEGTKVAADVNSDPLSSGAFGYLSGSSCTVKNVVAIINKANGADAPACINTKGGAIPSWENVYVMSTSSNGYASSGTINSVQTNSAISGVTLFSNLFSMKQGIAQFPSTMASFVVDAYNLYLTNNIITINTASEFNDWYTSYLSCNGTGSAYYYTKQVYLTNDIDVGSYGKYTSNIGKLWFSGTFDGQGHTIKNFTSSEGFFWQISSGIVRNVNFVGMKTSDFWYPMVGYYATSPTFSNCYFEGNVGGASQSNQYPAQSNCFFNHLHYANINNVVIIVNRQCGLDADPVANTVENNTINNLYIVDTSKSGTVTSSKEPSAHCYSSLNAFKEDVTTLPSGFDSDYWTIDIYGALVPKSIAATADYIISNKAEFIEWYKNTYTYAANTEYAENQYVLLTADIDLSGETFSFGDERKNSYFAGILDGQGHTISNLSTGFGLLSSVSAKGTIKNISFVNYTATNVWTPFAGNFMKGTMENVYIEGQFAKDKTLQAGGSGLFFYGFNAAVKIKNVVVYIHQPSNGTFDATSLNYRIGFGKAIDSLYFIADGIFDDNSQIAISNSTYNGVNYYNSISSFKSSVTSLPSGFSNTVWTMQYGMLMPSSCVAKYVNCQPQAPTINQIGNIILNTPVTLTANQDVVWGVEGLTGGYTLNNNIFTITSICNSNVSFAIKATTLPFGIFKLTATAKVENLQMQAVSFTDKGKAIYGKNRDAMTIIVDSDAIISDVMICGEIVSTGFTISNNVITFDKSSFSNGDEIRLATSKGGLIYTVKTVEFAIGSAEEFESWFRLSQVSGQTYYAGNYATYNTSEIVLTNNIDMTGYTRYETSCKDSNNNYFVFRGVFDGQGYTVYNLQTTSGIFFMLENATLKNVAFVGLDVSHNWMPLTGYRADSSTISNLYIEGAMSSDSDEHPAQQNVFYQYFKNSTVNNVVIIANRNCGTSADAVCNGATSSIMNNIYIVDTSKTGSVTSAQVPSAHCYSSLDSFRADVVNVPTGFSEKYWKNVGGQLIFKSVDIKDFVFGKNRTTNAFYFDKNLSISEVLVNGVEKTGYFYTSSTGKFGVNNNWFSGLSGNVSMVIKTINKDYNFIVKIADYAIGNTTEFSAWYSVYKDNLDKTIILTDDIDFDGADLKNAITNYWWTQATGNLYFNGIFDGNNYTISNYTASIGMFAGIGASGIIKNLKMTDFEITGSYGMLGCSNNGSVVNCYFEGKNNATETVNGGVWNNVNNVVLIKDVTVICSSDLDHSSVAGISGSLGGNMSNFVVVNTNSSGEACPSSSAVGYRFYTSLQAKENEIRDYQIIFNDEDEKVVYATSFLKTHLDRAYNTTFTTQNEIDNWDDSVKAIIIGNKTLLNNAGIIVSEGSYVVKKVGESVFVYATDSADYQVAVNKLLEYMIGFDDLGNNAIVYSNIKEVMPDMNYQNTVTIKSRVTGYTYATSTNTDVWLNANTKISNYNELYSMGYTSSPIMYIPNRYYQTGGTTSDSYKSSIQYHTAFYYLPPEMYGSNHSGWYASGLKQTTPDNWNSAVNTMSHTGWQLCYTAHGDSNELALMKASVLEYMKTVVMLSDNKDKSYIPFMQMDTNDECQCSACKTKGATLAQVEFLDDVIADLNTWLNSEGDLRTIKGVMFAYHTTKNAPDTNKTFNNVAILIAPIEAGFVFDVNDSKNATVKANMTKWSEICAETMIWLYQSHFGWAISYSTNPYTLLTNNIYNSGGYIDFYASVDAHISWLKFCRTINATFMFDQASHTSKVNTAFGGLKNYIDSKALVDLDYVEENYDTIITNYFNNYFGPAGATMKAFYDETNTQVKEIITSNSLAGSVSDDVIGKWDYQRLIKVFAKLDLAYQALEDAYSDKTCAEYLEYKRRIEIESISPRFINAEFSLGCSSSYYTTTKQGVYNDMIRLGFNCFAETGLATMETLKSLWGLS